MATAVLVTLANCSGELGDRPSSGPNDPRQDAGGIAGSGGGGAGEGGVAGSTGSAGTGGAPIAGDGIPMFVAQGHAGRTTISCDDGRTWVANRSDDDDLRCFDPHDCDHDAGAGRGITFADGWFVATFGWGNPGAVVRSRDGVTWEPILLGHTFSGVIYGDGRLLAASRWAQYSDDLGQKWTEVESTALTVWNVRRAAFVPHDGGRFVMAASDSTAEITVSPDGVDWAQPTTRPAECGGDLQTAGGIAYGNGAIVMVGSSSLACRSLDGGDTWSAHQVGGTITSHLLWTGSEFVVWGDGTRYTSSDGATWSSTHLDPSIRLGPVSRSDTGTFVGVNAGWQEWYENQVFYRSADGVHWEALPSTVFTGSHPIRAIAFGYGEESADCR